MAASGDTLFLLFSQTKVLTSSAVWALVEEGKLSFMDRIADHLPEFAARGKGEITLHQVMTHQGGFPSADVSRETWTDHARMRAEVCDFSLEWTPGTRLQYHPRAAHLTQAMVIEAVTGRDYRDVIRDKVLAPLGPRRRHLCRRAGERAGPLRRHLCRRAARQLGRVQGGRHAERRRLCDGARHGGVLPDAARAAAGSARCGCSRRGSSPMSRSNHTGERGDDAMGGIPMHRGLGPHVRGDSDRIRGLGTIAAPADLRPWRRRHLLFLGRPDERRLVHLPHQLCAARPVALGPARPHRQPGARRDRLIEHGGCRKINTLPDVARRSRESGNPGRQRLIRLPWAPAFAGATRTKC